MFPLGRESYYTSVTIITTHLCYNIEICLIPLLIATLGAQQLPLDRISFEWLRDKRFDGFLTFINHYSILHERVKERNAISYRHTEEKKTNMQTDRSCKWRSRGLTVVYRKCTEIPLYKDTIDKDTCVCA